MCIRDRNDTLLTFIDNTEEFVSEVFKQQRIKNEIIKNNLNIVYTPLPVSYTHLDIGAEGIDEEGEYVSLVKTDDEFKSEIIKYIDCLLYTSLIMEV